VITSIAAAGAPFVILAAAAALFGGPPRHPRPRPAPRRPAHRVTSGWLYCHTCSRDQWAIQRPDGTGICWDHHGPTGPAPEEGAPR
jgi:hypothetical protein